MPKPALPPLTLADCLCPICREILLEPVTLPCSHTLCNPCFQMTVEKASLSCPMCRRRVSTWARHHARSKTLVDKELWERIQREFPAECQRRASGQESEDLEERCTSYPVPQVSKPGELRQEYEQEVSKLEAERRAREEEEREASEAFIQMLLAEEEAEQARVQMLRQDQEEQLKHDEDLARTLSDQVPSGETSCSPPATSTPVNKPGKASSSKSCKAAKSKAMHSGDIQRFLSPVSHCNSLQFISSETENGTSPQTLERNFTRVNGCSQIDDEEMPVLSPHATSSLVGSSSQDAASDRSMPELSPKLGPEALTSPKIVSGTTEGGLAGSNLILTRVAVVQLDRSQRLNLPNPFDIETSKRKCVGTSQELSMDQYLGGKRRRTLSGPGAMESGEMAGGSVASSSAWHLMELEHDLYERRRQEEQDRLLALQLQRALDRELTQVNRQKGSPDGYLLRQKPSSRAAEQEAVLPQETIHRVKKQPKTPAGQAGLLKPRCGTPDENKKPSSESRSTSPANVTLRRKSSISIVATLPEEGKVLQSSNKQPTILEMFQRSAAK